MNHANIRYNFASIFLFEESNGKQIFVLINFANLFGSQEKNVLLSR